VIEPPFSSDATFPSASYNAAAKIGIGVGFDWDKFGFSFGLFTLPSDEEHTGTTDYSNFSLAIGGTKYIIEGSYREYKGFYDENTPQYDSANFAHTGIYYQDPDLTGKYVKGNIVYVFSNKKFCIKSAYSSVYRQVKSAGSFISIANVYYEEVTSANKIIPRPSVIITGNMKTGAHYTYPEFRWASALRAIWCLASGFFFMARWLLPWKRSSGTTLIRMPIRLQAPIFHLLEMHGRLSVTILRGSYSRYIPR
jgi:hypothetical protein